MSEPAAAAAGTPSRGAARPRGFLQRLSARVDLKTRLSLFIAVLLCVVLALAIYAVLGNSKRAVQGEIDAVMRLAANVLEEQPSRVDRDATDDALPILISVFDHTRHLCVERASGQRLNGDRQCPAAIDESIPAWFVAHVTTAPREMQRMLYQPSGVRVPVIVRSDPADEILEAWNEARPLLLLIVAIGFLTNAIVVVTVWRAFRPIDLIRKALSRIGSGDLHPGLPVVNTPELRTIIEAIADLGSDLEHARSDNRRLLRHSLEVQEQERRVIARELHDEIGQTLAGMDAEVALLQQRGIGREPELARRMVTIRAGIATLYDGLHALLGRLRPASLDELGLGPALDSLVSDWATRCPDIRFEAHIDIDQVPGEPLVQTYLYRIGQEALTNAARHAGAQTIRLGLSCQEAGVILLRISDDGCGFPANSGIAVPEQGVARRGGRKSGLGLLGMAERADVLGAELKIDSKPGQGTVISLRVPFVERRAGVRTNSAPVTELTRNASPR